MAVKTARENEQKKLYDVLKSAADIEPKKLKTDEKPDLEDLFTDDDIMFDYDMGEQKMKIKIWSLICLEKPIFGGWET